MRQLGLLIVVLALWSCDPCRDVTCENGTCDEGTCICTDGWEGTNCETFIPCFGIDCGDHGTCLDGICMCESYWSGDLCEDNAYCNNNCEYANDGECDDGGPNSDYNACACGTDCSDCSARSMEVCGATGAEPDAAIALWTPMETFPCNTQQIDISIDGVFQGSLTDYFAAAPEQCGEEGMLTVGVVHGTHTIYAECADGDSEWGGDVDVLEGYCIIIELNNNKNSIEFKAVKRNK